jgi:hypothetical protein
VSPGAEGDISSGQALARASTALTFIGVAAVGAGLTLTLLGRDDSDDADGVTLRLVPGPGLAGISLRSTF